MGCLALHYIEDYILGEFVEFGAVGFEFLDFLFEFLGLGIVAYHFYHRPAGSHAQLGEKVADQLHVGVVDPVEADGIGAVDNYNTFYHQSE